MEVEIQLNKTVDENASIYFEQAKKARKKIDGIEKAISVSQESLENVEKELLEKKKQVLPKQKRKLDWYEKFRWFYTSSGFLVVGGRDATTNELVIKKHTEKDDVVFHADVAGSPFMVVKTKGKKPTELDLDEVAQMTASYSRAWKQGLSSMQVFYVNPDQVSKTPKSGEYMAKGAFMIYGKRNYKTPILKMAIGFVDNRIEAGVLSSIKSRTDKYVEIVQGSDKSSEIAKKIKALIGGELDDIIKLLPTGGSRLVKGVYSRR
jgi:predicted ribosome quality control (RQC) complex YloA/Tae2 family protein